MIQENPSDRKMPLAGIRILAVSQFAAGPFGTLLLADLGAEIIKIEDPATRGDVSRSMPPYRVEDDSLYFQCFNRNKKSLTLNLNDPRGREIFHRLVRISHGVFNNLRGDVPARLGLTYNALREFNPAIVCCSLSAYGRTGPMSALPGYDYLVQASTGFMGITGDPQGPPTKCGISVIDFSSGITAAFGLLAGVIASRNSGVGCDVDVNLLDTALSMLNYHAVWYLNKGLQPERRSDSAHAVLVPCQNFRTRDGYLAICCAKEKFWTQLCEGLERPDLAADVRFSTFDLRHQNRALLLPILQEEFAKRTNAEWVECLNEKAPCAPVQSIAEALDDVVLHRPEMLVKISHPTFESIQEMASPVTISGADVSHRRAPMIGEHTSAILTECLGYDDQQIMAFHEAGII